MTNSSLPENQGGELRASDWCECQHPDHFDSGKDEHTYGAHIRANVTRANGARFCAKCAAYHPAASSPSSLGSPPELKKLLEPEEAQALIDYIDGDSHTTPQGWFDAAYEKLRRISQSRVPEEKK